MIGRNMTETDPSQPPVDKKSRPGTRATAWLNPWLVIALLALSLLLSSMTLTGGRATVLQGAVHLVVFAVFLFLAMVP